MFQFQDENERRDTEELKKNETREKTRKNDERTARFVRASLVDHHPARSGLSLFRRRVRFRFSRAHDDVRKKRYKNTPGKRGVVFLKIFKNTRHLRDFGKTKTHAMNTTTVDDTTRWWSISVVVVVIIIVTYCSSTLFDTFFRLLLWYKTRRRLAFVARFRYAHFPPSTGTAFGMYP